MILLLKGPEIPALDGVDGTEQYLAKSIELQRFETWVITEVLVVFGISFSNMIFLLVRAFTPQVIFTNQPDYYTT